MRYSFLLLSAVVILALAAPQARAQSFVTLDWGGSTLLTSTTDLYTTPWGNWYTQNRKQILITKQDFLNIGVNPTGPVTFNAISFWLDQIPAGFNPPYDIFAFEIKMKNTSLASISTFDFSGLTQVYGPQDLIIAQITGYPGWQNYTFTTPFVWDGVSNILIDVCHDNSGPFGGGYHYNYSWVTRYGTPGSNRVVYFNSDGTPGACTSTGLYSYASPYAYVPNMRFGCGGSSSILTSDPEATVTLPGPMDIPWSMGHPTKGFTGYIEFQLYTPTGQLVRSMQTANIVVTAGGVQTGVFQFDCAGITPGFYRLRTVYHALNSCFLMDVVNEDDAVMLINPGTTLCQVWPGDANNDGLVNYGDRAALNTYIHDANLRDLWLKGPQRYRVDQSTNPFTYYKWEAQPGVPWNTPDGCYMDTDGNGVINNFDYLAMKLNWAKSHGAAPKLSDGLPAEFGLRQNYPNPFNPSTTLSFTLPERSQVRIVVTDMLGREVAVLADGAMEAGEHAATFNGTQLGSGVYMARATMTGLETGTSYARTVKMTLDK